MAALWATPGRIDGDLSRAESSEVLNGFGAAVAIEAEDDATRRVALDGDIHVATVRNGEVRRHVFALQKVVPLRASGFLERKHDASAKLGIIFDFPDHIIRFDQAPQVSVYSWISASDSKLESGRSQFENYIASPNIVGNWHFDRAFGPCVMVTVR
jgi:hypothetical protein